MKIWSQTASQINNIENLNWNFNMWWNTFNLQVEIQKNEKELLDFLWQIQKELKSKWVYSKEIENKENNLKYNIEQKSTSWILSSYKEYVWKLKEVTEPIIGLSDTFWKLFKLGASLGTFITLLF